MRMICVYQTPAHLLLWRVRGEEVSPCFGSCFGLGTVRIWDVILGFLINFVH